MTEKIDWADKDSKQSQSFKGKHNERINRDYQERNYVKKLKILEMRTMIKKFTGMIWLTNSLESVNEKISEIEDLAIDTIKNKA